MALGYPDDTFRNIRPVFVCLVPRTGRIRGMWQISHTHIHIFRCTL